MAKEKIMETTILESKPKMKILPVLLFVALVIVSAAAAYLYWQVTELKKNPQAVAQQESQRIIDKVSKLIVLPTEEVPTIATVSDPELLKDQPFFDQAEKGDQLLIYTNAKKAILYSPSANKIVNVAPINIGNTPATK